MTAPPHDSLDPSDWRATRAEAHRMLDDMLDYVETIEQRPLWQPLPDEVRRHFQSPLPEHPHELAAVHEEFMRFVLPFSGGNVHAGFMGWVQGGGCVAGMLGEMLAAGLNANLGGRDQAPILVERQIAAWLSSMVRFPSSSSGLFLTGSSMANFIGILVARRRALGPSVRDLGLACAERPLVGYASQAAHACVFRAFDLAGLGASALRRVRVDTGQRMDVAALDAMIAEDRRAGRQPFVVVPTAGTVDVGAVDDLAAVADVAARENLWVHVDGAYGALGVLSDRVAPLLRGIERADSIALDFHKWGQVPYDAGFILVRDATLHQATFASPAEYLRRETRGLGGGSPWPCDFGPDLSRGFRALKTWFTLKVYGTRKLGAVIDRLCALASELGDAVAQSSRLELLAPVSLNIVCFRYRGGEMEEAARDALNAAIVADLHEAGAVAPSTTVIDGRLAIRAALVNHRTSRAEIDQLLLQTVEAGRRRESRADGQKL